MVNDTLARKIEICLWDFCWQWYLSMCVSSLVLISFFEVEWRRPSKEFSNLILCNRTSPTWQVILSVLFCYERCFPISPGLQLWCDERTSGRSALFQITRLCGNGSRSLDGDDEGGEWWWVWWWWCRWWRFADCRFHRKSPFLLLMVAPTMPRRLRTKSKIQNTKKYKKNTKKTISCVSWWGPTMPSNLRAKGNSSSDFYTNEHENSFVILGWKRFFEVDVRKRWKWF